MDESFDVQKLKNFVDECRISRKTKMLDNSPCTIDEEIQQTQCSFKDETWCCIDCDCSDTNLKVPCSHKGFEECSSKFECFDKS